eukprot:CAMPEP_0115144364 /NCGR_PEP_ID=MMETSP0227-20121206/61424_1 /TAXON_ID=89957 /ORGANISM="Polarella glacialis, Strain CCMP 1383" /LENGTH=41 /DNA_ID= /DNA_START= /DNA_END= /DNA_ORIENTATION=
MITKLQSTAAAQTETTGLNVKPLPSVTCRMPKGPEPLPLSY